AHPQVQQWLFDLARRAVQTWGYDYLKIDFLLWATAGDAHFGGLTHAEAYRKGLGAIRDGMGTEAFLLGCGAPLQHAVGYVNGMRIGTDVDASWGGIQAPGRGGSARAMIPGTRRVSSTRTRGRPCRYRSPGRKPGIRTTTATRGTGRAFPSRPPWLGGRCTWSSGRSTTSTRRS